MTAGEIIYARLANNAGVTAIAGTRIRSQIVPDKTAIPAIAYTVQLDTPLDGSAPLQRVTATLYCLAHTDADADGLADAVDAALSSYTATDGASRLSQLNRTSFEPLRDEELNIWGRTLVYQAWIMY